MTALREGAPAAVPAPCWPRTGEFRNHTLDSRRWQGFEFREGDVVIASWAKSGTTWLQQIVAQLVFEGAETPVGEFMVGLYSPWVECRFVPQAEVDAALKAKTHRRFMKTHLETGALASSPLARYLYIARDPRDAIFSWYHHHMSFTPEAYARKNGPGLVGRPAVPPDCDVRAYYGRFLDGDPDTGPGWPLWSNIQSWWDVRGLPNVMLLHYARLKADLKGEIGRIAAFLGIEVSDALWPAILEHCSFEHMKQAAGGSAPSVPVFKGGASTFFNQGTGGRWRDVLSPAEIARADELAAANLSPDCARWLATGESA